MNGLHIIDANTGDLLGSISSLGATVDWSPDGSRLMQWSGDASIRIWDVWSNIDELTAYAKECCVFRELTNEERVQFGLPTE